MKKILLSLFAAILCTMAFAQNKSETAGAEAARNSGRGSGEGNSYIEYIEGIVTTYEHTLPQDMGGGMRMTRVYIENNMLIYEMETDRATVANIRAAVAAMGSAYLQDPTFASFQRGPGARELVQNIINARMGIRYKYIAQGGSDSYNLDFPLHYLEAHPF